MKRIICSVILLAAVLQGSGATIPLYVNSAPIFAPPATNPIIDARAWYNRAAFDVTPLTGLPFEAHNNRFFTNGPGSIIDGVPVGGVMIGDPGFRFLFNTNSQRRWMDVWENKGAVATDHATFFSSLGFFFNDSRASILQVAATNITSTGPLSSGTHGLIRLEGKKINLIRNSLRTGLDPLLSGALGGGFASSGLSNYVNEVGVVDLYWGVGIGDSMASNRRRAMRLDGLGGSPTFNLPLPSSTIHDVVTPSTLSGRPFTNSTIVPGGSFLFNNSFFSNSALSGYTAVANSNFLSATSHIIQVVFYPTNPGAANLATDVRFSQDFFGEAVAVVGFKSTSYDIATEQESTDAIYLSDSLAVITNRFLARNQGPSTQRPNTYEITRVAPFEYANGLPGNIPFDPSLLYNGNYTRTTATNAYAGYAAQINSLSYSPSGIAPYDVTNVPGRIEIIGDEVNLDQTRIRAESAVIIKANNLTSNRLAAVDAPLLNVDLRSVQPTLVISNLAPATVSRLTGQLRAWSAVWQNGEVTQQAGNTVTNTVFFHVMIVESQLSSTVPVTVNEFAARATNVVINDQLNIGKSFVVEGQTFHLTGGLSLPVGANLGSNNLINVRNFTNDGIITMSGAQFFGTDRPLSYSNYVNRGTNIASSHEIRTRNFDNPGYILANGGLFSLDALTASLSGMPLIESTELTTNTFFLFGGIPFTNIFTNTITIQTASKIQGVTEVRIAARDLTLSNSIVNAGNLIVSVTNRLVDSGTDATNFWSVTGGFEFNRKPVTSDLLGTYLRSTTRRSALSDHVWPGSNLGATVAGFSNNMALGKLVLDGGSNSLFRFSGSGANNALYVDYIEFVNFATNFNSILSVNPNLTIYFANSSVPVQKLEDSYPGRVRWVSGYTGPLSSTNITYYFTNGLVVTSNTFTFNIALVTSKDLDSDGDGIVNADDDTPVYVAQSAVLTLTMAAAPERSVLLGWRALGYSSNSLEFKAATGDPAWQVLTNFVQGQRTEQVQVMDPIPTNGGFRVYRLRVDPASN